MSTTRAGRAVALATLVLTIALPLTGCSAGKDSASQPKVTPGAAVKPITFYAPGANGSAVLPVTTDVAAYLKDRDAQFLAVANDMGYGRATAQSRCYVAATATRVLHVMAAQTAARGLVCGPLVSSGGDQSWRGFEMDVTPQADGTYTLTVPDMADQGDPNEPQGFSLQRPDAKVPPAGSYRTDQ